MHDHQATDAMTLEDILSHQTGLPRHDALWYLALSRDSRMASGRTRRRFSLSPLFAGRGLGCGALFKSLGAWRGPLTRPPSAVDLSPHAGRRGLFRGIHHLHSSGGSTRVGYIVMYCTMRGWVPRLGLAPCGSAACQMIRSPARP